MDRKILITDKVDQLLINGLQEQGFDVHYLPEIEAARVPEIIEDYEGLIVNSKVYVGKEMFDKARHLKFVCRIGSGLEVIDLEYAKEKNVLAFNAPEGNRVAVAEHALGMLLSLMNNLVPANAQVHDGKWLREENRGTELSGKTVGLIAYGNNAQAFAKLLRGFDVRILAYDKYYHHFTDEYVKESSLQQIFDEADVVSLHLPLTAETTYMVDYKFLSSFKKPVWLINTSRGKVLKTADLLKLMEEGKVLAAALDVLENEKINKLNPEEQQVFDQLRAAKNVLLSPHVAGWTHESKQRIAEVLLEKIRKIYS